jgi:hypothetical protein
MDTSQARTNPGRRGYATNRYGSSDAGCGGFVGLLCRGCGRKSTKHKDGKERPSSSTCRRLSKRTLVGAVPLRTPTSAARLDVTLSVTLQYKTSPGDSADLAALFRLAGGGRFQPLSPGSFRLGTGSGWRTVTVVWTKVALPAAGRRYTFEATLRSRDGNGNQSSRVLGVKSAAVLEAWSGR